MDKAIISSEQLHFEHEQWKSELAFWQEELQFFQQHLELVVLKTKDKKVLARIDHFQNLFKIHRASIRDFKDAIETHEHDLARHAQAHVNAIDRIYYKNHQAFREKIDRERELYQGLKKAYYEFLAPLLAREQAT